MSDSELSQDESRLISGRPADEEVRFEASLRPTRMSEYIGQAAMKDRLGIYLESARTRSEALDHVLIFGPPGLGKTTLANVIAAEMGTQLRQTSGPVLEKAGDLAAMLTNLEPGDVLFVDDASTDDTWAVIQSFVAEEPPRALADGGTVDDRVVAIRHRGQAYDIDPRG